MFFKELFLKVIDYEKTMLIHSLKKKIYFTSDVNLI